MLIKLLIGFVLIALVETLNGIFRVKFLSKKLGIKKEKILSFVLGSFFILLLNLILIPWIAPQSLSESFLIGFIWMSFMIAYDLYVGRVLFKLSWERILEDFNIFKGNLLGFGMILIFIFPSVLFIFSR
jgi:hypothetical protein